MQEVGDFYDTCYEINIHGPKTDIEDLLVSVSEKQKQLVSNRTAHVMHTYFIYFCRMIGYVNN
jgi:hypothetical protein